jgi:hypothetical protein
MAHKLHLTSLWWIHRILIRLYVNCFWYFLILLYKHIDLVNTHHKLLHIEPGKVPLIMHVLG